MEINFSKQALVHKVTAVFRHLSDLNPLHPPQPPPHEHNYGLSNEEQALVKFRKPCCSVSNFHINW